MVNRELTEEEISDLDLIFQSIEDDWHIHTYPDDTAKWAKDNMPFALTILRQLDNLQEHLLFNDVIWSISYDLAHHSGFLESVDYLQKWDWLSKF